MIAAENRLCAGVKVKVKVMSTTPKNGPAGKEISLSFPDIQSQISFLEGKILTVIDAVITDERQLKATKDLIRNAVNDQLTWISQLCFPDLPMKMEGELKAQGIDPEEAILEAAAI